MLKKPSQSIVASPAPLGRRTSLVGHVVDYDLSSPDLIAAFKALGGEYADRAMKRPMTTPVPQPPSPMSTASGKRVVKDKMTDLLTFALNEFTLQSAKAISSDEAWDAVGEKVGERYRSKYPGMHEMFPTEAAKHAIPAAARKLVTAYGSRKKIPLAIERELNANFRNLAHARSPTGATGWVLAKSPGALGSTSTSSAEASAATSPEKGTFLVHPGPVGGGLISRERLPTQSESSAVHSVLKGIVVSAYRHEETQNPEGTTHDLTTTVLSAAVRSTQQQFFPPYTAANVRQLLKGAPDNPLTAEMATGIRNAHTEFVAAVRGTGEALPRQPAGAPMSQINGSLARTVLGAKSGGSKKAPPIPLMPASPLRELATGSVPPPLSLPAPLAVPPPPSLSSSATNASSRKRSARSDFAPVATPLTTRRGTETRSLLSSETRFGRGGPLRAGRRTAAVSSSSSLDGADGVAPVTMKRPRLQTQFESESESESEIGIGDM